MISIIQKKMKKQTLGSLLVVLVLFSACKVQNMVDSQKISFIDASTPRKVTPLILNDEKYKKQKFKTAVRLQCPS